MTDKVVPDGINNRYEFNLIFHFIGKGKDWRAIVEKTQGGIGNIFTDGESLNEKEFAIKMNKLKEYAVGVQRKEATDYVQEAVETIEKNEAVANKQVAPEFTKIDLAEYKTKMGVGQSIGEELAKAGLPVNPIDPSRKQEYLACVDIVAARSKAA